jgi:hypothetical protein
MLYFSYAVLLIHCAMYVGSFACQAILASVKGMMYPSSMSAHTGEVAR